MSSAPSHPSFPTDPERARSRIDRLVAEALQSRVFSAASLLVADPEAVLFEKTWGSLQFDGPPLRPDSSFDLASLTKPLVTVPLCMQAIGEERLRLSDTLSTLFPDKTFSPGAGRITVCDLLSHRSGFPAHRPFHLSLIHLPFEERREALLSSLLSTPLDTPPGTRAVYSDLGFLLLGFIIEIAFQMPLDVLFGHYLTSPTGATDLRFNSIRPDTDPTAPPARDVGGVSPSNCVATQICPWRKRLLVAEVDDENAYALGGVAGHAGLFGTARGIFLLLRSLWRVYKGAKPSPPLAFDRDLLHLFWTRRGTLPDDTWAIGFDTPSPVNSSAGSRFSRRSVGHLGFTGVSFWVDLDREVMVILLTNRIHPSRQDDRIRPFRPALHDAAAEYFDALSKR